MQISFCWSCSTILCLSSQFLQLSRAAGRCHDHPAHIWRAQVRARCDILPAFLLFAITAPGNNHRGVPSHVRDEPVQPVSWFSWSTISCIIPHLQSISQMEQPQSTFQLCQEPTASGRHFPPCLSQLLQDCEQHSCPKESLELVYQGLPPESILHRSHHDKSLLIK